MNPLGANTERGAEVEGPACNFSFGKHASKYSRDTDHRPRNGRCTYVGMLVSESRPALLQNCRPSCWLREVTVEWKQYQIGVASHCQCLLYPV